MNLFDDGQAHMANLNDHTQVKEMTKNPSTITMLEERVNEWIKKVMEVSNFPRIIEKKPHKEYKQIFGL